MFERMTKMTIAFAMTVLLSAINLCLAQTSSGAINGTITDSSGAAIPGANIEVTNTETGEKRKISATDIGSYSISNLAVGIYDVTATGTGFSPNTIKAVKVSVAFNTTVDLTLNVAGASEVVEVTTGDTQTQINTTDQQLSTLIDNRKLLDLPLLSRDPNSLILLAPGTVQTNGIGGFSVNGSRERNNNFLIDGADNNDTDVPGIPGGLSTPNIDATEEFRVITSNFNAEYGRNTGAIINVVTKSGTNEFHGGAYIFYRSDAFAARDFFDVSGEADQLQRRQFGGSVGGPIKKDKAFFFFNYEGDRFNFGEQQLRDVPSAAARTGILNTDEFGTLDITQNGANNATGVNAFGDPNANLGLNPAITQLLNLYPLGNDPNPASSPLPGVIDAFRFSYVNRNHTDSTVSRIDYKINEKHTLSGSHNFNTGVFAAGPDTFPGFNDGIRAPQRAQVLALKLISNFTANVVNEAHFNYNRVRIQFNGAGDGGVSSTIPDAVNTAFSVDGLPLALPFGGANGSGINLFSGALTDLASFDTQFRFTGTTSAGDTITYIHGAHNFKFGGEHRWIYSNGASNFSRAETLTFDVPTTFGTPLVVDNEGNDIDPFSGTGGLINNYASFLYGLVSNQFQSQFFNANGERTDADYRGFRVREFDLFFSDTWKVRSNLTLNYGLRYEVKGVPYEVNGQFSTLVNQDASGFEPPGGFVFQFVGNNSSTDNKLYENDFNNFAPRFGFAYSPGFNGGFLSKLTGGPGKTSIRGGYGIFYDRVFTNLFSNASGNPPFQQTLNNFAGDTLENVSRPSTLTSSPVVPSDAQIFPVIFALPGNNIFQEKFATPYEQKWNFGFQRALGNQFLVEADYVGAKGTNELRFIDGQLTSVPRVNAITGSDLSISNSATINATNGRLNDAFFGAALNLTLGFSTYHALQTRVTKTFRRFGFGQFQVAYTWSHSIDNSSDPLVSEIGERTQPRDSSGFAGGFNSPERGNSGFDIRHRVVANFIYDIPFESDNKVLRHIFGNFTMSGIITAQSGHPYSIFGSVDTAGSGLNQRADFAVNGNGIPASSDLDPRTQTGPTSDLFANPVPPSEAGVTAGLQGTVPRNAFVGPAFNTVDFSILKNIPITERYKFRIQADFFNLFNRVNLAQPVNTITSLNFGQSVLTASTPRIIQFAARFNF